MSASPPLRIDALPFFGHIVQRIDVRRGAQLATGLPHVTLELKTEDLSPKQIGILRNATIACPACGSRINPFRTRRGRKAERVPESVGRMFVSVACRYEDSSGCARGKAASAEVHRLVQVIEQRQRQRVAPPPNPAPPTRPESSRDGAVQLSLRGLP